MTEQERELLIALEESGKYDCFEEGFNAGWLARAKLDRSVELAELVMKSEVAIKVFDGDSAWKNYKATFALAQEILKDTK